MKYNDLSVETAFVIYHTKHIASVCDGDTQETREIKEMEE